MRRAQARVIKGLEMRKWGKCEGNERKFARRRMAQSKKPREVAERSLGAVTLNKGRNLARCLKAVRGCQLLDMEYEKQLEWSLKYPGGATGLCPVKGDDRHEDPFHYRNKVHAVFGPGSAWQYNFRLQENTHIVVPVERC